MSRTDSEGSLSTSNSHHGESNEWSTSSSRKGLSIDFSTNEDDTGACEAATEAGQTKAMEIICAKAIAIFPFIILQERHGHL